MSKLILTQEVDGLGTAGDIVDVKAGYARNYLLPHGYAVAWTAGGARQVEQLRQARAARELATIEEARDLKLRIENVRVRLEAKAGREGRLFGAVKAADIAEAIEAAGIGNVDRKRIVIADPIKTTGDHRAQLKLHPEVVAEISMQVVAKK
ncbi:50S ribosomal protein L9 [Pseudoclavibacter caeni]|uniref:Large ribosomal subunit protein bL9 n=1 Tax=Pseudoclavibacter caeni TaxID=908846 RepID=A0A7C8BQY1_9MICO|nr:50S ribosomal protein L9 [Pseudoclavibacter caeni]KAB1633669.1 50S ribosomal protein L9 [Pseudoclavibacter caeni]NYJ96314.1 large subunit ribosomal protein L9 [Pseudoclavibacter caeni]